MGRDDNQPAKLSGALPIWANVFKRISREPLDLPPPEGVELVWIDSSNGLRASEACSGARQVTYLAGSAPNTWSPCAGVPVNPLNPLNPINDWFRELF